MCRLLWPTASVSLFGSVVCNLSLPSSDLDILVSDFDSTPKKIMMEELFNALKGEEWIQSIQLLSTATVPIIKLQTENIHVDISFENTEGVKSTEFIKEVTAKYPLLQPFILAVKALLQLHSLNQTFTGGIGSYLVSLLCYFHFLVLYSLCFILQFKCHLKEFSTRQKICGQTDNIG